MKTTYLIWNMTLLITLACVSVLGMTAGTVMAAEVRQTYRFKVLLDEKPIGFHSFEIVDTETGRTVDSYAKFKVSLWKIPVYRYEHRNREVWRNGCLQSLVSTTDDNGRSINVSAQSASNTTMQGSTTDETRHVDLDDCMMSFAYWDPDFLAQARLVNPQNGEVVPVQISRLGIGQRIGGLESQAELWGYRIKSDSAELDIRVWYSAQDDRWMALESRLAKGRTLVYVPDEGDIEVSPT